MVFEKMLTYANHVGLFAEEIGPSGEQLGNFPQAFTHLALINSALRLDRVLDTHDTANSTAAALATSAGASTTTPASASWSASG
jgi:hypothetical protein